MRTNRFFASIALAALAAGGLMPVPAAAQLANASASTLGLSGNNTATVRGFGAISVNPAGLAMPGSGFSLTFPLLSLQLRSGLDPITLSDLANFDGILVPNATKQTWLDEITAQGGQTGTAGADLSQFALTLGNIGLQASTIVSAAVNLPPGMMEALLFGNAGRTGSAANLDLGGASIDAFAMTTAGVSLGIPLSTASGDMALGATLKYTVGHGLAIGRGSGNVQLDPIEVNANFPMVHSCEVVDRGDGIECDDFDPSGGGTGIGLDVGFMMKQDRFSLGASVTNVLNTFEWDVAKLAYRPGTASLELGSSDSSFDPEAYSGAPAMLKSAVDALTFKPSLQVGAALDVSEDFTISGDLHNRFSDEGIALSPKFHLGAGAEFRGLKVLHLRGGAAVITDGIQ